MLKRYHHSNNETGFVTLSEDLIPTHVVLTPLF